MSKEIIFYSPIEPLKNKAGTAILTIDWYKKQFKLPISEDYFKTNGLVFSNEIPNLSDVVSYNSKDFNFQGKVEKRLFQYPEDIIHILISPIK
jgi:hypothetical protein